MAALRSIGVRTIIAFSAVGSLQEQIKPRDFVVPDQVIDRTKGVRPWTFYEGGMVGHVGFADPFDVKLGSVVRKCGERLQGDGVVLHEKGTLICMGKSCFGYEFRQANDMDRGTSILHARRISYVPIMGRIRYQHVCTSRGKACKRG